MSTPELAFAPHDHTDCKSDALSHAEDLARQRGLRLTPVRRRTLEILLSEHRALGAYEILERLTAEGHGSQPPVAYRALDFLVENGLAHRVRRLNAFTACTQPGRAHTPAFFICEDCDAVAEVPSDAIGDEMVNTATPMGFSIRRMSIEAVGTCPKCAPL